LIVIDSALASYLEYFGRRCPRHPERILSRALRSALIRSLSCALSKEEMSGYAASKTKQFRRQLAVPSKYLQSLVTAVTDTGKPQQ
jgi:hypothetical protein